MAALAERTGWQIEGMCANGRQNAWQAALSTQIADYERPTIVSAVRMCARRLSGSVRRR
jgi:hypothetical protein